MATTVTIRNLDTIFGALVKLKDRPLPGAVSYALGQNLKICRGMFLDYETAREDEIKKRASKDHNGEYVFGYINLKTGAYIEPPADLENLPDGIAKAYTFPTPEIKAEADQVVQDMLTMEHPVAWRTVRHKAFDTLMIEPEIMEALDNIIIVE